PNLFVCDGSILPTQGSANPGLTIQALGARTADYVIKQGDAVFFSNRRDLTEPGIRYDLSPPYTRYKGNPRIAGRSSSFFAQGAAPSNPHPSTNHPRYSIPPLPG